MTREETLAAEDVAKAVAGAVAGAVPDGAWAEVRIYGSGRDGGQVRLKIDRRPEGAGAYLGRRSIDRDEDCDTDAGDEPRDEVKTTGCYPECKDGPCPAERCPDLKDAGGKATPSVLDESAPRPKAEQLLRGGAAVLGARAREYDSQGGERSAGKAAAMWSVMTGKEMTEVEAWQFLSLLKHVRLASAPGPHDDSAMDAAVYATLAGEAKYRTHAVPKQAGFNLSSHQEVDRLYWFALGGKQVSPAAWQKATRQPFPGGAALHAEGSADGVHWMYGRRDRTEFVPDRRPDFPTDARGMAGAWMGGEKATPKEKCPGCDGGCPSCDPDGKFDKVNEPGRFTRWEGRTSARADVEDADRRFLFRVVEGGKETVPAWDDPKTGRAVTAAEWAKITGGCVPSAHSLGANGWTGGTWWKVQLRPTKATGPTPDPIAALLTGVRTFLGLTEICPCPDCKAAAEVARRSGKAGTDDAVRAVKDGLDAVRGQKATAQWRTDPDAIRAEMAGASAFDQFAARFHEMGVDARSRFVGMMGEIIDKDRGRHRAETKATEGGGA